MSRFLSLAQAVEETIRDGDTVAMEGFTHLIPHAAGHEIIRQGRKRLTLIRMTPDLIYDQMIGMGCAARLVFSWGGNPGVGSLHRLRDAIENKWPNPIKIEEHSHAAMANAYEAGAAGLPCAVFRGYIGVDLPKVNPRIKHVTCPFTGEELAAVPAHRPDVAVIHALKADRAGNVLIEGIVGVQKEAVLASKRSRTPVYISGYDPGYEEVPFPGLYDPATAGDVSPLLNAFEAAALVDSPCPRVDAFELAMAENPVSAKLLGALASVCERTEDPVAVRGALDELSWSLLDATLAGASPTALNRSAKLICQHEERMTPVHRRVTEAIKSHACPPPEQAQPSAVPAQQPTQQTQIDIA